jgi:hypothetical protein
MSRWEPHIDLMRLLEALGSEVVAATELEVREACAEDGWSMARAKLLWGAWPELQVEGGPSMARTAKEVRELIEAVNGDPGDPEIDVEKGHIKLRGSRHLQGVVEPGGLTCYKQH